MPRKASSTGLAGKFVRLTSKYDELHQRAEHQGRELAQLYALLNETQTKLREMIGLCDRQRDEIRRLHGRLETVQVLIADALKGPTA